jgi:competence protein ComEC
VWAAWGVAALACAIAASAARLVAGTIALLVAVACAGILRAATPPLPPDHLARVPGLAVATLAGRVASEPTSRGPQFTSLLLDVDTLVSGESTRAVRGRVLVSLYGAPPPLAEGQRIFGEFRLRPPRSFRNPGAFDYAAHLARRDIHLLASSRADRLTLLTADAPPWRVVIKRRALAIMHGALPPASAALLAGLLLGERAELPQETHEAFRRAGVYHVLAVSGFNVALLAAAVFAMLTLVGVPRRAVAVVAIAVVIGFAFVVGPEPSVLRAAIMGVILLSGLALERETRVLNSVAAAALAILALRPGDLMDPGFQLSFGATLGLVLLGSPLASALGRRGVPSWLASGVAVSLAAQLAVTPVMLAHFNQLSLIGVVANLAVVPLAAVATVAGLLAVVLALASDVLGGALFDGVWLVLLALRASVHLAALVPAAMIHLPAPPWPATVAFHAGLALGALALRSAPSPGVSAAGTASWHRRALATLAAAGVLGGTLIELWPVVRPADGKLRATFLDVGQGDAIAIELPDGRTVLVDAGPGGPGRLDAGARVVAPFLWNRGVQRLALVVPTHEDADHAGGVPSILERFHVKEVWSTPGATGPDGSGYRRRWFGDVAVGVLHPPEAGLPASRRGLAADRNNGSLVLRVDFGLVSLLLTGDIEHEAEEHVLASGAPLRSLVLKVGHHGGARSTTDAFLDAVSPSFAVVSAGAGNRFGHPAPSTLERLRRAGARIYRTDEQGAIELETDGATLTITTWATGQRERFELYPAAGP